MPASASCPKQCEKKIHCLQFTIFPPFCMLRNLILDFLRRVCYYVSATCRRVHVTAVRPRAESRLLPARCHRQKKHRLHCVGGVFFYAVVPNDTKHYSFSIIRSVTAGVPQYLRRSLCELPALRVLNVSLVTLGCNSFRVFSRPNEYNFTTPRGACQARVFPDG